MHLYIHIPFCRQACHYCDFHFSTNLSRKADMVTAICEEIKLQQNYLNTKHLQTIYLGGGTPSLLTTDELHQVFDTIQRYFSIDANAEITLEANPDDFGKDWKLLPYINRLSIGIQSFNDQHLHYLHRIHTADEASSCVKQAQDAGIQNITIDLIYAIPAPNHTSWQQDLEQAVALQVPHISAYCLTIEPQTVFGKWLKTKQIAPIDDTFAAEQFQLLIAYLQEQGFEQYEISNFAKPTWHSRHNSSYWKGDPYLGVGPSAHSFDGRFTRQYNVSNNAKYLHALQQGNIPCEVEYLTITDRVNEYLLTTLRTQWGCSLHEIERLGVLDFIKQRQSELERFVQSDWLVIQHQTLYLTAAGKLFADKIAAELFLD
ncbi:MAG: radical SAM family heme chaperone HemW [Spirosomataceae bacterium]